MPEWPIGGIVVGLPSVVRGRGMASGGAKRGTVAEPLVRVDVSGSGAAVVGAQAGISPSERESLEPRLRDSIARLDAERVEGRRPFLELAGRKRDLDAVLARAEELRGEIDWCVVVAGEGSALGNQILLESLPGQPGEGGRGRVGLIVLDRAEPDALGSVLDRIDLHRTLVHVISRAGESLESLASFLVLRDHLLRELGAVEYARHLLVTTDADAGPLRQVVNDEGLSAFDFPSGVAGHQAASSPVHLLGAALLDLDVTGFLAGVRAMDEKCGLPTPSENPAALLAATYYLLSTLHGVQISVLDTYSDRLGGLADWWCQFWSPTVGKKLEGEFSTISVGTTPVHARGTADHHTQLQLYIDGPADKVITFVRVKDCGPPLEIPSSFGTMEDLGYLGGRPLGEMLALQQRAAQFAVARAGRPFVSIEMPAVTPHALGQALRLFESAALLCASLHDVDPHARPAVEATQKIVFGALGRPGFESEAEALQKWLARREEQFVP